MTIEILRLIYKYMFIGELDKNIDSILPQNIYKHFNRVLWVETAKTN